MLERILPRWAQVFPAMMIFLIAKTLKGGAHAYGRARELADQFEERNAEQSGALAYIDQQVASRERGRIARELHGALAHCLTTAHVYLQLHHGSSSGAPPEPSSVAKADRYVCEAIDQLRQCVLALRDSNEDVDLGTRLRHTTQHLSHDRLIVRFKERGEIYPIDPGRKLALHRVLREALTNAVKRAHANTAWVLLDYNAGQVHLKIEDNGIGGAFAFGLGRGLDGLRERIGGLGGTFDVTSTPKRGSIVAARFECSA